MDELTEANLPTRSHHSCGHSAANQPYQRVIGRYLKALRRVYGAEYADKTHYHLHGDMIFISHPVRNEDGSLSVTSVSYGKDLDWLWERALYLNHFYRRHRHCKVDCGKE